MDLTDLARLPGAADQNFEALTRAVVSRRYGALGTMRERRNQPGVEFCLRVDHAGALGDPGRIWGWSLAGRSGRQRTKSVGPATCSIALESESSIGVCWPAFS
ncbi:hypothetical protein [Streptomyces sp. NPDC096012]|uniref:hypothetical protein n=1 Tax=Streptomyces sp. NPDC096012 TaxID=3155684 RepID=UPI00336AA424